MIRISLLICALSVPVKADVLSGTSTDPIDELNALYTTICRWTDGEAIPSQVVDVTHDGADDYLLSYNVACRGQENAFTGSAGTAHQIWVSLEDTSYLRILDANALDINFETRDAHDLIVLSHRGDYCLKAVDDPCFVTLEFTDNALIWADAQFQHPSMDARLKLLKDAQEETSND